ncbi:6-phosphogluconolactonase [Albibacillus kandeliae]|uniref:6-phosphogluconolactonase n=1 Tax=Albibacillus kandeliae TaxID=2174228 RepID=UPI000D690DC3|nr:6-phosphogluconolactonase [Albibacillus kandeliae]
MNLIEYSDEDMLAIGLANVLVGQLENTLFNNERASFAVPGGTTPGPVFDAMSGVNLDWSRVHVLPTDERWVPEDHDRSNARLIRSRLLTDRAAGARFISLYREGVTPEMAALVIAEELEAELPISVLLLGMGGDMHTASLFPGAPGLLEALAGDAPAVAVLRPETQPEPRISLTARALEGAMSKHLVITGAAKREALERAMRLPPEEAPVQAVLGDITVHWAE